MSSGENSDLTIEVADLKDQIRKLEAQLTEKKADLDRFAEAWSTYNHNIAGLFGLTRDMKAFNDRGKLTPERLEGFFEALEASVRIRLIERDACTQAFKILRDY